MSTIYDFVKNKFRLTRLEYREDLNEMLHEQLPRPMQRRISETQLVISVIEPSTPPEVMCNIFERLNTGGMPLNPQEVRNALVKGPVREYLERLANSDEFLRATANSVKPKRMADRECVLRFLAFYITPWEEYEAKSLDAHLVRTMQRINAMSKDELDSIELAFRKSMAAAERIFVENDFRKFGLQEGDRKSSVNKPLLEAWSVQLARCSSDEIDRLVSRRRDVWSRFIELMKNNSQFEKSISYSTTSRDRIRTRFVAIQNLVDGLI